MCEMKTRPSLHIYFTDKTQNRLRNFVQSRFGSHRALSMIVQQAVEEYLNREEAQEKVVEKGGEK